MRRFTYIVAVAALLTPPVAGAEEVQAGFATSIEYDDNIFNSQDDPTKDTALRVTPIIGLRRTEGKFVYDVHYEPRWEHWIDGTAEDIWDHNAFGRASWQVGPRTTLKATDRFLVTRSLSRAGFIADPGAPDQTPVTDVEVARQRIQRNLLTFGLEHLLSNRLISNFDGTWSTFDTDREDRFDSSSLTADASLTYVLSARDRVGGGLGLTQQTFEDTDTQNGSETLFYRLTGSWIHAFGPTMTLSVRGGPTFIDASTSGSPPQSAIVQQFPFEGTGTGGVRTIDSSTCPTTDDGQPYLADRCELLPTEVTGGAAGLIRSSRVFVRQVDTQADDDLRMTIFANIEFTKRWERWRTILRYQRSDSSASGTGQATILDFLAASLIWEPTDRWMISVSGSFSNRQSASNQQGNAVGLGPPTALLAGPFRNPDGTFFFTPVTASPALNLRLVESDNFTDVQTWQGTLLIRRWIGKNSQAFVRATYVTQTFDGVTSTRDFDNFRIMFGIRMLFDWYRI